MDLQNLFNIAIGLILSLAGYMAKQMFIDMRELEKQLHKVEVDLPTNYVSKQDFHERFKRIEDLLERIYSKLDEKVDK